MMLSTQFPELFRKENYAITLALDEKRQLSNVFDEILASKSIDGIWDKDYSLVPFGELAGRKEGEKIGKKQITMGYTSYGAIAVEASGKVGLSTILQQRSKEFSSADGMVDEPKFAGHIADVHAKAFLVRRAQRWAKLTANIFNLGGIQAGHDFFNQRSRSNSSDVTDSDLIYDGSPLFALPTAPHTLYANSLTRGADAQAVGNYVDYEMSIQDTGGTFNAFIYPPSYWALRRVYSHFVNNMQYDDNGEIEERKPDTLLVSSHNIMTWVEILKSRFIEPYKSGQDTNIENIFMLDEFPIVLKSSPRVLKNTWYLGCAKSGGIITLKPNSQGDLWEYWRDAEDRSYWISFEDMWGMWIRNWRCWCAGSISIDGVTPPTFGDASESDWNTMPAGI